MPPKKAKKSEGIKKGKIILKPIINALQKKAIEKLEKRININGFRWQLVNGLFMQCEVRSILEITEELNINHLGLANNLNQNLIYDLAVFNPYEKLQNLIMPKNNIESLQPILYINAPVLWRIDFGENFIRDMRAFRKMHCPKLVMFRIGNNKLSDLGQFEYCYCPELYEVTVEGNQKFTWMDPLMKLQAPQFKHIYAQNTGIVNKQKIKEVFSHRHSQMYIVVD